MEWFFHVSLCPQSPSQGSRMDTLHCWRLTLHMKATLRENSGSTGRGGCDPPIAPPPTMVKCDMGRRGWKGPNCIGCRQKWQLGMASAVTEHRREEAQQTEVLVSGFLICSTLVSDALVHSTPGSGISVCGVPVSGAPVSGVLIHGWRLDLGSSSRSRICYTYSGVESAREKLEAPCCERGWTTPDKGLDKEGPHLFSFLPRCFGVAEALERAELITGGEAEEGVVSFTCHRGLRVRLTCARGGRRRVIDSRVKRTERMH
uniref:Uncharacterized protein n=1 Tax=Knipowitschia caucasica TaxID=637954 RepID=A0AAV2K705_KNICA